MAQVTHDQFIDCLTDLMRKFGYIGTGSAEASGISSNKNAVKILADRSLSEYIGEVIDSDWDKPRKIGYLAAYVACFGPRFSLKKLTFTDGDMYPDKANVKTYIKYGCVTLNADCTVTLTEKGRALIAPYIRVSDADMENANAS